MFWCCFFFQSFYACVFFLRNFRFSTFDNISFFSQRACCCFWLHCMWNQIHLIRISISTKIPNDLLIYFANDWIQYANLSGRLCQGELCDIVWFWCILAIYRAGSDGRAKTKSVFKMSDLFLFRLLVGGVVVVGSVVVAGAVVAIDALVVVFMHS